jgi:hypothetical protein
MPAAPASSAGGPWTSRKSRQPTSRQAPAGVAGHDPRREDHRAERPQPEHDQRVSEQAVAEPPAPRAGVVLGDGQRRHVALPAAVEVRGRRVMDRVAVAPVRERREDEHAEHAPEPQVAALGRQERAVRAIVENDVGAQQEARRQHRDR